MPLLRQTIWRIIWKRTVEKSQTSATNVNMHPRDRPFEETFENTRWKKLKQMQPMRPLLRQVIWGDNWKRTVEKSDTNATYVTLPRLMLAIWGLIWKSTPEKSQTNATSVPLPALPQVLWGDIWRGTDQCRKEKSHHLWLHISIIYLER